MSDQNDLPLERESRDLPMSLLADGVAEHYGRRIRDYGEDDEQDNGPAGRRERSMSKRNEVASTDLLGGPHRCDTCTKEFPTCDAEKIVWGIDRDPSARGADADRVLECDAYTPND